MNLYVVEAEIRMSVQNFKQTVLTYVLPLLLLAQEDAVVGWVQTMTGASGGEQQQSPLRGSPSAQPPQQQMSPSSFGGGGEGDFRKAWNRPNVGALRSPPDLHLYDRSPPLRP